MNRTRLCVSSTKMTKLLEDALDAWSQKWDKRIDPGMTQKTMSTACNTLIETLSQVKNSCYKKSVRYVHKHARPTDSNDDLNILRLRALVSKFAWQIQSAPYNTSLRRKLVDVNKKLETAVSKAAIVKFNDDMKKQEAAEQKNDTSFWDITGTLLNKSAYQTSIDRQLTQPEIEEKLKYYDDTFINLNPETLPHGDGFEKIIQEANYKLNSDVEFIESLIERTHKIKQLL